MRDAWSEPPRRSWLHAVETAALLILGGIGGAALFVGARAAFAGQREQIDAIRAALTRPDVAALLRGEAVAVPKKPTDDMVVAGDEANPTIWEDGTSEEYCVRVVETIYRAMLAASPFAEEGKE